jgi:hypothetical protein
VTGNVTDAAGNALEGVNVQVLNQNYPYNDNNLAGDFGRFGVHLPTGSYSLRFSKDGFAAVTGSNRRWRDRIG